MRRTAGKAFMARLRGGAGASWEEDELAGIEESPQDVVHRVLAGQPPRSLRQVGRDVSALRLLRRPGEDGQKQLLDDLLVLLAGRQQPREPAVGVVDRHFYPVAAE